MHAMTAAPWSKPDLQGKVALVAGATRGAGRAIAIALAESGATVYCTGRSTRAHHSGRPETIDETADIIRGFGGKAHAIRVDHTQPAEVEALVQRITKEAGRLDILVNDIWGGDELTEWGKPFWEHSLDKGLTMIDRAIKTHLITSRLAGPLVVKSKGIIVEITDGTREQNKDYRGNVYYDLVKNTINRLVLAMAADLKPHGVAAIGVTPGFLRSEAMLEHFGVTAETWREGIAKDPWFAHSETPAYVGRAVAWLCGAPNVLARSGGVYSSWDTATEFGFTDGDGARPHWGKAYAASLDSA